MNKIPVIIDTDPGVDDIVALLLALASPEIEILAIVVSFGNTDLDSSLLNVLKAYQAVEDHLKKYPEHEARFPNFFSSIKTILARGKDQPLAGRTMDAEYFHGRDGLGDISERHPDLGPTDHTVGHSRIQMAQEAGHEVCLSLIQSFPPLSITYIILGPLTNFAALIHEDQALVASRIGRVVCMGGALDVPGNTTPVAEFNFFADPYAVKEVLCPEDGDPPFSLDRFLLLPLDITTPHELPYPVYKERVDQAFEGTSAPSASSMKPPLIHFTSSFLERSRDVMLRFGKDAMELHDIVAVWCAISIPPSSAENLAPGWMAERRIFDIERTGELTRGMLVVDRREDESVYPVGANRAEVQAQRSKDGKAVPARVEVESLEQALSRVGSSKPPGVPCVTKTPGPGVLLELLLRRVWGV
ncbi:nucleoside hydrolase [Marasmius fiardii PR-910]|nr:nucleoside hydrolase [Marasmius fiardii PR-910]